MFKQWDHHQGELLPLPSSPGPTFLQPQSHPKSIAPSPAPLPCPAPFHGLGSDPQLSSKAVCTPHTHLLFCCLSPSDFNCNFMHFHSKWGKKDGTEMGVRWAEESYVQFFPLSLTSTITSGKLLHLHPPLPSSKYCPEKFVGTNWTAHPPDPLQVALSPPEGQAGQDRGTWPPNAPPALRPTAGLWKRRGKNATKGKNKKTSSPEHGWEERTPFSQGYSFLFLSFWPGSRLPAAPSARCLARAAFMASWGTPWMLPGSSLLFPTQMSFISVSVTAWRGTKALYFHGTHLQLV